MNLYAWHERSQLFSDEVPCLFFSSWQFFEFIRLFVTEPFHACVAMTPKPKRQTQRNTAVKNEVDSGTEDLGSNVCTVCMHNATLGVGMWGCEHSTLRMR